MREIILAELIKDVLGPREGIEEKIEGDPRREYITGILAPRNANIERDPDSENINVSLLENGETGEEDEEMDNMVSFSSDLHPQSQPYSMGISFFVETVKIEEDSEINICVTWSRYFKLSEEIQKIKGKEMWQRHPRVFVMERIKLNRNIIRCRVNGNGQLTDNTGETEISIVIRTKKSEPCRTFIAVYLVNEIVPARTNYVETDEYIFQPQIRIVTGKNTKPVNYHTGNVMDEEKQELEFLYRNRPAVARGHMCSAVWKEIDPLKDMPDCSEKKDVPFVWLEGETVKKKYGEKVYDMFLVPDIRTEFVPVYLIPNPDFSWRGSGRPELDPMKLSELWAPEEIEKALSPFYSDYREWIGRQKEELKKLKDSREQEIAQRLINRCEIALERIQKGINLLKTDPEVRVCFCFANRAIALQMQWNGRVYSWRPFQLAFILMVIESIACYSSPDRDVCDLLWVPTGGGKTEAYLAVIAFTLALRRRRALKSKTGDRTGAGTAIIMRYTLRLLTIQQFRRALKLICACEYLRVCRSGRDGKIGWRPEKCNNNEDFIWGSTRFSAGLWVGGNVTPNRLQNSWNRTNNTPVSGAIEILKGTSHQGTGENEPAQVLNCPACNTILAFPDKEGIKKDFFWLHLIVRSRKKLREGILKVQPVIISGLKFEEIRIKAHGVNGYYTLSFGIRPSSGIAVNSRTIDNWWKEFLQQHREVGFSLVSARASRPGYFIKKYYSSSGRTAGREYDFAIFCPNPECPLHTAWMEGQPAGEICDEWYGNDGLYSPSQIMDPWESGKRLELTDGNKFVHVPEPFRLNSRTPYTADRIPIPAFTVDEQIYSRCPSLVISTVDKFARLPFEPCSAAMFGNVEYHHCIHGYYREYSFPARDSNRDGGHPSPAGRSSSGRLYLKIEKLQPPELIIQDELHLIEGPLGSLVGLYETAIDYLCETPERKVKYIASTATVTRAADQVKSIFNRRFLQFPVPGLTPEDRFFMYEPSAHPLDKTVNGRLYAGICAPGFGPLTPIIRIWSRILQTSYELARKHGSSADPYWTVTGYFNAVRELAGARAVCWQDIPERIKEIARGNPYRIPDDDQLIELSSRISSSELPSLLDTINSKFSGDVQNPQSPDVLLTTSMFGTGIDIPRLGIMIVHGQPKTTSSYIQSTGRVGRNNRALIVTFYRSTRQRDMSHYEMFGSYHQALTKFVEPVTVAPFSPGAVEKAIGPVMTAILRNAPEANGRWNREDSAPDMANLRQSDRLIEKLPGIFEKRAKSQPATRMPEPHFCELQVKSGLDRWQLMARTNGDKLKYVEYFNATSPAVLGDPQHVYAKQDIVFYNAPQSLRDVEETISVRKG